MFMRILKILLLIIPLTSLANESALVEQFFGPNGIPNKQDVYAGEMLNYFIDQPTVGESLSAGIKISPRLIEASEQRKAYAVVLSKDKQHQDWYIYLINDQGKWKISAVRSLSLPDLFFMALSEIKDKINKTKDEERQYSNMLLTLLLDSELKAFLLENTALFEHIAKHAKDNLHEATESAKALNLNYVRFEEKTEIIDVNIGGMLDNAVGYLYVPDSTTVPTMSEGHYIYIERITGNWYVYKTT